MKKTKKPVKKTVKKIVKKAIKKTTKKTVKKDKPAKEKLGKLIGEITHYYDHIGVGIIKLKDTLVVGKSIRVKGGTTDFEQEVKSMQIEHEQVNRAGKGNMIGLKVKDKVREGDLVYIA